MAKIRSVLDPAPQPLGVSLMASVFGHGCLTSVALVGSLILARCGPTKKVIDIDQTMQVSMVVLPKSKTHVPDRASRVAVARGKRPVQKPTPKPVRESDMVIRDPNASPDEGYDRNATDDLLRELEMEAMLDDLDAPDGAVDRNATDPNSTSDMAINASGPGVRGDPEFIAYINKLNRLFKQHFRPIEAVTRANPDLLTVVHITADSSGRVTGYQIAQSSGNASYDAAAETAVAAVPTIPLPPQRFRGLMAEGYQINFRPPR